MAEVFGIVAQSTVGVLLDELTDLRQVRESRIAAHLDFDCVCRFRLRVRCAIELLRRYVICLEGRILYRLGRSQ
jgi:hypothetical protein